MTDIVKHQPTTDLTAQMEFARIATSGSGSSILPDVYRGNPANVLIAVNLGASMGLSPAEALYRIAVIKGKPSASAELIAANVRKAGHKLRVRGDESTCTAQIIRADDPDYPFEVTRDMAWAKGMGLDKNDNYRKQPGTMLQWRAITAVARLACPEALYGVAYTPDELEDARPAPATVSAAAFTPAAPSTEPEPLPVSPDEAGDLMTDRTRKQMFALFGERGIADEEQLPGINHVTGKQYESRADLTEADALVVIEHLKAAPDA